VTKPTFCNLGLKIVNEINIKISCDKKLFKETKNTKFLGSDKGSSLSWKDHNDQMMLKPGTACYAVRYVNVLYSKIH